METNHGGVSTMPHHKRVLYVSCPLCGDANSFASLGFAVCELHPLYWDGIDKTITWNSCRACGHVFTNGYFSSDTLKELFSRSQDHQVFIYLSFPNFFPTNVSLLTN
jgi:hypothetical protein